MKKETVKKLVGGFQVLAYIGVALILYELVYGTYQFLSNNLFFVAPWYGFVCFYGYLFVGLALMLWTIKNRDLLERKGIEHQLQKRRG